MHVAFLTPEYPHPDVKHAAGIGTFIKNISEALVKEGFKVSVFIYGQNQSKVFDYKGVSLHLIKKKSWKFCSWFLYRKFLNKYVNKIIEREDINLIEAADWTGITAFMNFKIPLVLRFHGSDAYFCHLEERKQKLKNFIFEKLAIKRADAYVSPSAYAKDVTASLFGLNKRNINVIPNGLNLEKFSNDHPSNIEKNTLLYFGTLIRKKGVFLLAEIFNELIKINPELKLVLIGADASDILTNSSSTFELMRAKFSPDAMKRVKYLGKLPYDEIKHHIEKAHLCIFPSYAETFGMVTIEAMAMQKVVLCGDLGWNRELINHNHNGILLDPNNLQQWVTQINCLIKTPHKIHELSTNALSKVKSSFAMNLIVKQNIELYKSLLYKC